MKVYVLLMWWYDGDSWISNSFLGVFLTKQQAADLIPVDKKMIEGFIDYKTKQESPIYVEGYEAKEFGQYGSDSRYEIREIELVQPEVSNQILEHKTVMNQPLGDWSVNLQRSENLEKTPTTHWYSSNLKQDDKLLKQIPRMSDSFEKAHSFTGELQHWDTTNIITMKSIKFAEQVQYCNENEIVMDRMPLIGLMCMVKESEHPFLFQDKFK